MWWTRFLKKLKSPVEFFVLNLMLLSVHSQRLHWNKLLTHNCLRK